MSRGREWMSGFEQLFWKRVLLFTSVCEKAYIHRFLWSRLGAGWIMAAAVLSGCGSSGPAGSSGRDATSGPLYTHAVEQLAALNREAESDFANGKSDDAAALIEKGKPLETKLLSVSHPTLAAVEALSDRDQLYGRMLFSNRHYGWARLMFQKNLARWKYWKPQTADTERRFKDAQAAIDECDRHIDQ